MFHTQTNRFLLVHDTITTTSTVLMPTSPRNNGSSTYETATRLGGRVRDEMGPKMKEAVDTIWGHTKAAAVRPTLSDGAVAWWKWDAEARSRTR